MYGFPFYGPAAWQRGGRPDLRHVVVPSLQLLQRPVHTNKRCMKKILFATAAQNTHITLFFNDFKDYFRSRRRRVFNDPNIALVL